jgi:ABC-type uncharacterized transport system substrate-binding protein
MRKRKMRLLHIIFVSDDKRILRKTYFKDIMPSDKYIVNMSIKKFCTDDPCIIYRTNIIKSFQIDLYEYIVNHKMTEFSVQMLPENVSAILFPPDTAYIKIAEGMIQEPYD